MIGILVHTLSIHTRTCGEMSHRVMVWPMEDERGRATSSRTTAGRHISSRIILVELLLVNHFYLTTRSSSVVVVMICIRGY
jgi:hypothetical protein